MSSSTLIELMIFRMVPDEEKLKVYVMIVRLLLEVRRSRLRLNELSMWQCQEWGQAQTYFSRASLLIHTSKDKETSLAYRLSQVSSPDTPFDAILTHPRPACSTFPLVSTKLLKSTTNSRSSLLLMRMSGCKCCRLAVGSPTCH